MMFPPIFFTGIAPFTEIWMKHMRKMFAIQEACAEAMKDITGSKLELIQRQVDRNCEIIKTYAEPKSSETQELRSQAIMDSWKDLCMDIGQNLCAMTNVVEKCCKACCCNHTHQEECCLGKKGGEKSSSCSSSNGTTGQSTKGSDKK